MTINKMCQNIIKPTNFLKQIINYCYPENPAVHKFEEKENIKILLKYSRKLSR